MALLQNLDWDNWTRGLVAALVGGGSAAVVGGFAFMVTDPSHAEWGRLFKSMMMIFGYSALKDAFLYLKQNPLPKVITVTTTETTTRQNDPPAIVTTKVEETKVTTDETRQP